MAAFLVGTSRVIGGPAEFIAVEANRAQYRYYFRADARRNHDGLRRMISDFDDVFAAARERVFAGHGLRGPERMTIALAGDARIFQRLTGRPWYVAGLYDPLSRRLFFQNPAALRRRGILRSTVTHELCHVATAHARRGRRDSLVAAPATNARIPVWLEEGYCEALANTSCEADQKAVHRIVRSASDWQAFHGWLESRLGGGAVSGGERQAKGTVGEAHDYHRPGAGITREERRQAFCVAALFVSDWTAAVGRKRAFAYLTGSSTFSADFEPQRFYPRFYNKFR
ncbi:MAG: hypothetical protein NXI24_00965 [bacterium]|nr:hypothetical protein [bacterium]